MIAQKTTNQATPYLTTLTGILLDYLTTTIGLNMGFQETNLLYHPATALLIFWGTLTLINKTIPQKNIITITQTLLTVTTFLAPLNNTLLITRILR